MRCADLTGTWNGLRDGLDKAGILIMPPLEGLRAAVRLDADVTTARPAGPAELDRVLERLRALVARFDIRAVYVGKTHDGPLLTSVTIRVLAGGVVHELTLAAAAWHLATDLDGAYAR
jgi:hypothetical protein